MENDFAPQVFESVSAYAIDDPRRLDEAALLAGDPSEDALWVGWPHFVLPEGLGALPLPNSAAGRRDSVHHPEVIENRRELLPHALFLLPRHRELG